MLQYHKLRPEIEAQIRENSAQNSREEALRRNPDRDRATLLRPAFVRDVEKIMNCPYYNRYADKTQVFSFYKNDDISRRALHVQLVSRIARNIGRLLGLNLDLIEAIALGHDLGHTPFGHIGETLLHELYHEQTGRSFQHNIQSVRVLDGIFHYNISLQTLNGILCHNGEFELASYHPAAMGDFADFDALVEDCILHPEHSRHLIPSTLEGCVVRVSDMIAYIGKDRQDAVRAGILEDDSVFVGGELGRQNAAIINNMIVSIVNNSYGKDYLTMDPEIFADLRTGKGENYAYIYGSPAVSNKIRSTVEPYFARIYERLLQDVKAHNRQSVIYRHHIDYVQSCNRFYETTDYENLEPNQLVVDYIASMTDDYFVDLYAYLFPGSETIHYIPYFH